MANRPPFRTLLAAGTLGASALLIGLPVPAAGTDRPIVAIQTTVLARALLDAQRFPQTVVISEEDVARGYHEVPEPVEVDFRSNHPGGVVLGFALSSLSVTSVEAQAFEGGVAVASGESVFVPQRQRGLRARTIALKLRLKLAPDAAPGAIAFPVAVSLAPLK
jgi:hypothetical protein